MGFITLYHAGHFPRGNAGIRQPLDSPWPRPGALSSRGRSLPWSRWFCSNKNLGLKPFFIKKIELRLSEMPRFWPNQLIEISFHFMFLVSYMKFIPQSNSNGLALSGFSGRFPKIFPTQKTNCMTLDGMTLLVRDVWFPPQVIFRWLRMRVDNFLKLNSRVIYPGLPRTWDPLMVSGTHTMGPISLGIGKWEWD